MSTIGLKKILQSVESTSKTTIDIHSKEVDVSSKEVDAHSQEACELDELYWFVGQKSTNDTRENVYVITAVMRNPRQIVGFDVVYDKSAERIQNIVDNAPCAKTYATDGYPMYLDVVFPGKHIRNINNKNDTFTVEGVNADLRHYTLILARRSRCFARTIDT